MSFSFCLHWFQRSFTTWKKLARYFEGSFEGKIPLLGHHAWNLDGNRMHAPRVVTARFLTNTWNSHIGVPLQILLLPHANSNIDGILNKEIESRESNVLDLTNNSVYLNHMNHFKLSNPLWDLSVHIPVLQHFQRSLKAYHTTWMMIG